MASKWPEREFSRSSECIIGLHNHNGKPRKVMYDNGKKFTSKFFRRFLVHNQIKDKQIGNAYPRLQGTVKYITR